jgi:RimJ/RimL family protein N-acetyltransferase
MEAAGALTGARCRLVPFDTRHSDNTLQWANDPALGRLLDRARPVSDAEHQEWFRAVLARNDAVFFAIEEDGRHVGNVWLWAIDARHQKAELRVLLGAAGATGRGVGSEAIDLACRYAFARLNLHKIYAYVLGINPRARRAFEKAGFAVEGELKADRWVDGWIDVHLLARIRP